MIPLRLTMSLFSFQTWRMKDLLMYFVVIIKPLIQSMRKQYVMIKKASCVPQKTTSLDHSYLNQTNKIGKKYKPDHPLSCVICKNQ